MSQHTTPARVSGQVEYRPVEGFPGYRVGDDGTVWSLWLLRQRRLGGSWRKMKLVKQTSGYLSVSLRNVDGIRRTFAVHRLVLLTFVGKPQSGHECMHSDDNKENCRLDNLSWGTHLDNMLGASIRDRRSVKLTNAQAAAILSAYRSGLRTQASLAEEYGVSRSTVNDVVCGRRLVRGARMEGVPDRRFKEHKKHYRKNYTRKGPQ